MSESTRCPFCGFKAEQGQYELLLHVETLHSDTPSPFAETAGSDSSPISQSSEASSESTSKMSSDVPNKGGTSPKDSPSPVPQRTGSSRREHRSSKHESTHKSSRAASQRTPKQTEAVNTWRRIFGMPQVHAVPDKRRTSHASKGLARQRSSRLSAEDKTATAAATAGASTPEKEAESPRLGKSALGRHAHEKQMPGWLSTLLEREKEICAHGIIQVLGQLYMQNPSTQVAYLCDPRLQHISKMRREGGFCGYRNIQMLISWIIGARAPGHERFSDSFPTIFQIQDLIENAWDMGHNSHGRIETGGIRGTRKYIGTPEAHALFSSLGIPCSVQAFRHEQPGRASNALLGAIEKYFMDGTPSGIRSRVHATDRAPIYFQHQGHSMTIVGFERHQNGEAYLLVFDPSYRDSRTVTTLVGTEFRQKPSTANEILKPYRRGSSYLRKHNEFELL